MVSYHELLKRLRANEVEFVVIGGIAAALLGSPVATTDMDVCAPLDDANLDRLIKALDGLHPTWRFRPDKVFAFDNAERFRGFKNVYLTTDLGILDILGELPGIGSFESLAGRTTDMNVGDGLLCRVLDIDTLIAAKRAAGRQKDLLNVRHLEAIKKKRGLS